MQFRQLGRTGCTVSEIGFGAWGIGGAMWQGGDDDAALAALEAAFDLGVNFVDTALAYGDGHSENLVGRAVAAAEARHRADGATNAPDSGTAPSGAVAKRREPIVVASKIPPEDRVWPARPGTTLARVFSADYVKRCAETSAANLGRPVDVLQFHVWRDEWLKEPEWRKVERALASLIAAGTVRHVGISNTEHDPTSALEAVRHCDLIEVLQVIYNIFDQQPQDALLPACLERRVGVIVRVPLDEGGLTGTIRPGVRFPPGDWRHRYFRGDRPAQVAARVETLRPALLKEAGTLAEGALRFCLSHDAVGTVIAGMRTAEHARENCAVSDGRRLSPALLAELTKHAWPRNFYQ
ncbi:MAG TPA: aldo/keto reductase [Gemmatimonadales bacterium]|nr:aldo/keto reductase [Gemmatimonadales bacterium]